MNFLRPSGGGSRTASQQPPEPAPTQQPLSLEATQRKETAQKIHSAIRNTEDTSTLKSILDATPSAANSRDPDDQTNRTPLHTAADLGRIAHLEVLLSRQFRDIVDINALDFRKQTALHLASRGGHADCVERLLRAGANTEITDINGHLASWYASVKSDGAVKDLFDSPPRVDNVKRAKKKKKKKTKKTNEKGKGKSSGPFVSTRGYTGGGGGGPGAGGGPSIAQVELEIKDKTASKKHKGKDQGDDDFEWFRRLPKSPAPAPTPAPAPATSEWTRTIEIDLPPPPELWTAVDERQDRNENAPVICSIPKTAEAAGEETKEVEHLDEDDDDEQQPDVAQAVDADQKEEGETMAPIIMSVSPKPDSDEEEDVAEEEDEVKDDEEDSDEDSNASDDSSEEERDPVKPATHPRELEETLCREFRGSFWEPNSGIQYSMHSVWDLVYVHGHEAARRRSTGKKWFHLTATSKDWAKDLARNICFGTQNLYTEERCAEACKFMERVFNNVDDEGPVRKHHFVAEKPGLRRRLRDEEDVMYAVVLPIIDVDKGDYLGLARQHRMEVRGNDRNKELDILEQAHKRHLDRLVKDPTKRYQFTEDPLPGSHLERMMQLSSIFDHPVPRSLDQSYHEYLDEHQILRLDSDQVLTRYITWLKEKGDDLVKQALVKGATALESVVTSHEYQGDADPGAGVDGPPMTGSSEQEKKEEPKDLITVPHFYLFKLNSDTIITLYPERWDNTNEARLHKHILLAVDSNHGDLRDTGSDSDSSSDSMNMDRVAETILDSCLSFEAKAFAKCQSPHVSGYSHDVELTFGKAYANTIAEMYTVLTRRYDELKDGLGSLGKDPNEFYRHVSAETKLLIQADDNISEIRMIKRILQNQIKTVQRFKREVWYRNVDDSDEDYTSLETFDQLETEAERVRAMAMTILDLRQREAAIEDVLNQGEQSTMLFIFTTVTVLFSPLALVCSILAMPITGLPETWDASPLAEVFGLATLGTAGLCFLMWVLYRLYQDHEIRQRNKNKERRSQNRLSSSDSLTLVERPPQGTKSTLLPRLRFRGLRRKGHQRAVEGMMTASGRSSRMGYRTDVEKGV